MFIKGKGTFSWEHSNVVDVESELILMNANTSEVIYSGATEPSISHSGQIVIPYSTSINAKYAEFTMSEGDRINQFFYEETFQSLPSWELNSYSFYPRETSFDVNVVADVPVGLIVDKGTETIYLSAGASGTHSFTVDVGKRGESASLKLTLFDDTNSINYIYNGFSLPSNNFEASNYHMMFIKAAKLSINGKPGLERIIFDTMGGITTIPTSSIVPGADQITPEQIQRLQNIIAKFLIRHPDAEEFVRRFSLWLKYQNLDFEDPGVQILTVAQKLAFLSVAGQVVINLLTGIYTQLFKTQIEEMNNYLLTPSGSTFYNVYQTIMGENLANPNQWNLIDGVTF